jgi:prephenate dehydratase
VRVTGSIAIQGERGSFSEAAGRKLSGSEVSIIPCATLEDVFAAVDAGNASAAVVPIENSLAGSVLRTYELLATSNLVIAGETLLRIRMNLIARPGARLDELHRILSHPVALAQCQRFLAGHPDLEAVAAYDTAGSVKLVMESGDAHQAAIAGEDAARIYGAAILVPGIEDHEQNYTRFLLVTSPDNVDPASSQTAGGALKTTVLFRTPNRAGALFRALAAFALRDINLTKLESRPIFGRPWEYAFYADISGGTSDRDVANALNHLREMCETVVVLGSYPAASEG